MILQEKEIISRLVATNLTESELRSLKAFLKTEENYNSFLDKVIQLLIGQETKLNLSTFLELHNLQGKEKAFQNTAIIVIEELVELTFKGISSEYANWLNKTGNKTYHDHFNFLKQTKKGIDIKERIVLKARFESLKELSDFELSDEEIKKGVKFIQRKAFKEEFKQKATVTRKKASRIKVSTVLILVFATSIVLAISVPQVRNQVLHLIREIFDEHKENHESGREIGEISPIPKDTIAPPAKVDTVTKQPSDITKQASDSTVTVEQEPKKVYPLYGNDKLVTLETYRKHFTKHKNTLKKIEGIWELYGKFKFYGGTVVPLVAVIREIDNDKYEMIFFSDNKIRFDKLSTKYYLSEENNGTSFKVLEYSKKKLLAKRPATLNSRKQLTIDLSFILPEMFNNDSKIPGQRLIGHFSGSQEMLNSEIGH